MHVFQIADNQADIPNDSVILLQKVADVHNQTFSSLSCRIKKHPYVGNYWQEGKGNFLAALFKKNSEYINLAIVRVKVWSDPVLQ